MAGRLATRADINKGVAKATKRFYDCCVDLGFEATDTVGQCSRGGRRGPSARASAR